MRLLCVTLLLACLSGCSLAPDRVHKLDFSLIAYEKALRWGSIETVVAYMAPGQVLDDKVAERYGQVSIGGYNTLSRTFSDDGMQVNLMVAIDYIDKDSMKVYKLTDNQVWEYSYDAGRWFLTSKLPSFN